ncbi:MAG: type II toxin-antitoxin system VapC family toxin [Nostocales cyanobacterium]|nr:MAG: type II toxin-antitoxin system VapC family toxin [Nostocales cyanobacterium]
MSVYILDTNIITAWQKNNEQVVQRIKEIDPSKIFVTAINVEEQLRGRLDPIRQLNKIKPDNSQDLQKLVSLYRNLRMTQEFYCKVNILDFDQAACECFQQLLQQHKVSNKDQKDLRIAAIALVNDAILVTQNRKDFIKFLGFQKIEDWTVNI